MNYEEFMKNVGIAPAKIIAKLDKKDNASISMEGRGLELIALSLEISKEITEKTHTDVDDYCNMLKQGIKGKIDDSKADEESKEESQAITKKQFKDAWMEVLKDIVKDNDLDGAGTLAVTVVTTKYVDTLCKKLFGEGLTNE